MPVELQIKYEHFNRNLELRCLNKLSALMVAVQHTDFALLSVLTTRYLHSIRVTYSATLNL